MAVARICEWCNGGIGPKMRSDARFCAVSCRQKGNRFRVGVAPDSSLTRRMRFGYADPPYLGLARRYYGPSAQEVNHRILIGTLEREYPDGWALSASASSLATVLPMCPPGATVCPWIKGAIASVARRPHNSWEPLIVVGGRERRIEARDRISDSLLWGGRQHSHPDALVGMKPAAFCEWMFRLLGAEVTDTLDDIFPGSGAVSRAWKLYTSRLPGGDPSRGAGKDPSRSTPATSRLAEAQSRLAELLGNVAAVPGDE